jgi:hypothetical protein
VPKENYEAAIASIYRDVKKKSSRKLLGIVCKRRAGLGFLGGGNLYQSGLVDVSNYARFWGVRIYARWLFLVGQVTILGVTCLVAYRCLRTLFTLLPRETV